ncbi:Maf family protein [Thaumasiovibrio subtropicus]|uniref:Maf family protein n=1 Tax=Thaumasiovibrio subtropicus TaxID=1891207 RepID=UPI000B35E97E|nr:Maf family protein [Thaumasiovibrio subtropicus]
MSSPLLYLASASPRRKELLTQLGYAFDVLRVDVAEVRQANENAEQYVQRLSQDKAKAGVAAAEDLRPVIGSDTIVVVDGAILEKPKSYQDSQRMLRMLSGRNHQVMTAVSIADGAHLLSTLVTTDVWFRDLSESDIESYWQSGEPQDKAGSYGIQGLGGKFVSRIEGSYFAVVGLPLYETDQLIKEFSALS